MFNFGSLFGGIGSFLGGMEEAKGYRAAASGYKEAARITELSGGLKDQALIRNAYQVKGAATAATGASGIKLSGSALDVVHSNTQQAFLTKAITDLNTRLEYTSYIAQAKQAEAQADAAEIGGIFGGIGGILGFFSDDRLKEDIKLVGRRGDGLGIYTFRFKGSETIYSGVLADEVAVLHPNAITVQDGFRRVDYDSIGVEFKRAA
jgi:hypothetical protein